MTQDFTIPGAMAFLVPVGRDTAYLAHFDEKV